MADLPIACALPSEALQARRDGLLDELFKRAEDHELTHDGLKVRFAADGETLTMLARVVDAERQCCRFLRFQISVEPDGGPVLLEISGPAGTREFMSGLLGV